jgi:hypothetical protein
MSKSVHQILLTSKKHSILTYPVVYAQSLVVIGTFFWVPYLIYYLMKRYNKTRERAITLLSFLFVLLVPVTKNKFIQNLFVWCHYARYFQTKVVGIPFSRKQTVFGIIPHGIVPLTLGDNYLFLSILAFLFIKSCLFSFPFFLSSFSICLSCYLSFFSYLFFLYF